MFTLQFHTDPSVQHISSTQKVHSFSAPKTPQFHTINSSVHHIPQIHIAYIELFLVWGVSWTEGCVELRGVWNWGVFGVELLGFWCGTEGFWCWTEECVELRGFWCGTEGCVELRGFRCGTECFWELKRSGPFVWNWCVELTGFWCGTEGDPKIFQFESVFYQ